MNYLLRPFMSCFLFVFAMQIVTAQIPKPTKEQVEWADCEIGAIIHFDINVYEPEYQWRGQWNYNPDPKIFNPEKLDTDQWVKAVKDMGGEYAVLVVKHCTGFCLWPSEAHDYTIKNSPWKSGKGDILAEFVKSCKKYGVRPGIYYSAAANGYYNVDNPGLVRGNDPGKQKEYNAMVEQQLTEIYSNYGDFFEIWFDGGCLPPEKGGPDIVTLLHEYQSKAVVFQGPEGTNSLIRWVGNERGVAPYPCWSTTHTTTSSGGDKEIDLLHGNYDGPLWCPGEADFPIRHGGWQGGWFYHSENSKHLMSLETLIEKYYTTAGRNTNMLIGVVVDQRGLVPEGDVKRMKEFGDEISKRFTKPIANRKGTGNEIVLELKEPQEINHIVLMEDISQGERVRSFELFGKNGKKWISLGEGSCIGHKYIHQFKKRELAAVKLVVNDSVEKPIIRNLSVYQIE